MAETVDRQHRQKQVTEGVESTMDARGGLAFKLVQKLVAWAEELNLRYAVHGNPPVYDNAEFPWAAAIEKDWRRIRAELDRLLIRKDELPGFHEIAADVRPISAEIALNALGWATMT